MKKTITFFCLLFSFTMLKAQISTEGVKGVQPFECPQNALYCFTEIDNLWIFPYDGNSEGPSVDMDFDLVTTKLPAVDSFSRIRFWGFVTNFLFGKNEGPPAFSFQVNFYEVDDGKPGDLIESILFEGVAPTEILDEITNNEQDESIYLCQYDLDLPDPVAIDAEAFISITPVDSEQGVGKGTKPQLQFFILGNLQDRHKVESFAKDFAVEPTILTNDSNTPDHLLLAEKNSQGWEPVPFKPFFALYNPPPVPVSNFAVYLVMLLIAGSSVFLIRRWIR